MKTYLELPLMLPVTVKLNEETREAVIIQPGPGGPNGDEGDDREDWVVLNVEQIPKVIEALQRIHDTLTHPGRVTVQFVKP